MGPQKLSDEEIKKLEALVSGSDEVVTELNEAEKFVLACSITEGPNQVMPTQVWVMYIEWTDKPIRYKDFFAQFRKLFKLNRWGRSRFYKLNLTPLEKSQDSYWVMRKRIREKRIYSGKRDKA